MEQWITNLIGGLSSLALFAIIAVTLYTLGKGADWLVDEAVILSTRWGLGKAVIGATIVSIGTTTPEAAVSVLSAIQGKPGLALGNAVGSIICDTGLILGLASLIAPLPLNRELASPTLKCPGRCRYPAGRRLFSVDIPGESFHGRWHPAPTRRCRLRYPSGVIHLSNLSDGQAKQVQMLIMMKPKRWKRRVPLEHL